MDPNTKEMLELYGNPDETLKANGFDDCIIGVDYSERLVYSINKIIDQLVSEDMTREDALDHFGYNIAGAYVGEFTPIFVWTE